MRKPNGYEQVQVHGDYVPLEVGGHYCVIKQVEEMKSKTGLDMLKISLDTANNDKQPHYYMDKYRADTRPDKRWACCMYLVVDENTDYGTGNLKGFVTAVENSNPSLQVCWDDRFAECFRNREVGVVFGREQYRNQQGELKWSTKPKWFRTLDTVLESPVPDDKYLAGAAGATTGVNLFQEITDDDGDVPF